MNMRLRIPDACDACKEASPSNAGHGDVDPAVPFAETTDTRAGPVVLRCTLSAPHGAPLAFFEDRCSMISK